MHDVFFKLLSNNHQHILLPILNKAIRGGLCSTNVRRTKLSRYAYKKRETAQTRKEQ